MHICTRYQFDVVIKLCFRFWTSDEIDLEQCQMQFKDIGTTFTKIVSDIRYRLRFKYSLSNYANIYSIPCIYTMYAESTDWPQHQKSGIFVLAILVLCRYVFLQKSIVVVHLCSKTFEKHLSAEESPDLPPSRIFAQVHGILMEMENVFPVKSFTKC